MAAYTDKEVIRHWLKLRNWLKSETYRLESWPEDEST